jgi:hypothetical protein
MMPRLNDKEKLIALQQLTQWPFRLASHSCQNLERFVMTDVELGVPTGDDTANIVRGEKATP